MFKCSVKIDENLQKEINRKMWTYSLILTIVGSIGLCLYFVLGVKYDNAWTEVLLWVTAVAFGFGITYLFTIKNINKKAASKGLTDEIELFEEYANVTTVKNNETISTMKVYYKDLIKTRDTENYFLLYINKASALTIPKQAFTSEEISTIKLWVNSAKTKKTSNS